jgi:hypothetical protein
MHRLPAELRLAVWAASLLGDGIDASDLIRVHDGFEKISFYRYDNFESDPLPALRHQCKIDLRRHKAFDRYAPEDENVRLIGKSRFLNEESIKFADIKNFDQVVEMLLDSQYSQMHMQMSSLAQKLWEALYEIDGQKLVRSKRFPSLDERCGSFFTYRDLIECGETQTILKIDNLPRIPESYAALYDLARNILDPVIEYFGSVRLTYGFCSNNLRKHIKTHIAPLVDQHAAYELNSKGKLVCPRIGAAVDFLVEDENMYDVVRWIHDNLEYDRIYYYGPDRPIHVSYNKTPMREITELHDRADGKRIPKRLEFKP